MRWFMILAAVVAVLTAAAVAEAKFVFRDGKWVLVPDEEEVAAGAHEPTKPPQVETPPRQEAPLEPAPQEKPLVERPAVTQPPEETSPPEKPVEEPIEQPAVEKPAVEPPVVQRPPVEEPVVVKPPVEEPVVEKPPVEEPVVVKPPVEEPVVEKPPVEEPVVETPPARQPGTEETAVVEKPAAQPPSDGETAFEFRDGRWVPVIKAKRPEPTEKPVTPDVAAVARTEKVEILVIPTERQEKPPIELPPVVEVAPLSEPALALSQVLSVGEKYRHPAPSQAADEADQIVKAAGQASPDELEAARSMIERFRSGRFSKTARAARKFLKKHPNSACAEAATWLRAEAIFSGGDYYKAFGAYEDFIGGYAGSRMVHKALVREMEIAEALLGPARRKVLGLGLGSGNDEAIAILEKVYAHRPTGPLAADAIFRIAEFNTSKGKFEEAEEMYRRFLDEFPNHARSRQAQLLAAQSAMASNFGPTYDDGSMRRAHDLLKSYQDKYPEMAAKENVSGALEKIRRNQAQKKYEMAAYYWRAKRRKAATFYARKVLAEFPGTPAAAEARQLLGKIAGK